MPRTDCHTPPETYPPARVEYAKPSHLQSMAQWWWETENGAKRIAECLDDPDPDVKRRRLAELLPDFNDAYAGWANDERARIDERRAEVTR